MLLTGAPDLDLPIHRVMEDDGVVLVCPRFRSTHKSGLFRRKPTGHAIGVEVFDMFRLEDGRLIERRAIVDSLSLMKQLGATLF